MSASFDPYSVWLGIQGGERPPSHYRLLGLADFESDKSRIAAAAEETAARMAETSQDDRATERQVILDAVAIARLCLLSPTRKAIYDAQLRTMRPEQPAVVSSESVGGSGDFFPPTATAERVQAAAVAAPPFAVPPILVPPIVVPTRIAQPVPLAVGRPATVVEAPQAAPVKAVVNEPEQLEPQTPSAESFDPVLASAQPDWSAPSDAEMTLPASALPRRAFAETSNGVSAPLVAALVTLGLVAGFVLGRATSRNGQDEARAPIPIQQPAPESTVTPTNVAAPLNRQEQPVAASPVSDKPSPLTVAAKPPATEPEKKPQPEPAEPPVTPPDPVKTAALREALRSLRAAMAERDMDRAKRFLADAEKNISSPEQQDDFDRYKLLYGYVDGFWDAVGKSLAGLQAADELVIGSTRVAVIDASPNSLSIKMEGRVREYTVKRLPAGLARMLADRWFDSKPANKLYLGAFYAVDAGGDKAQARRLWQEASAAGASAEDLFQLLDDESAAPGEKGTKTPAVAQLPPPESSALEAATRKHKTQFAREYTSARFPPQKGELAKKFFESAASESSAERRYVLLRESLHLFRDAAQAQGALSAADELGRRYKIDSLALKTDALGRISSATNNTQAATEVASAALELVAVAIDTKHLDQAAKLVEAARVAAAKSRSAELIGKVKEEKAKLQSLLKPPAGAG